MQTTTNKMTGETLAGEIGCIIHDYGDEYGWDLYPSVDYVIDVLADQARKGGWSYDSKAAREIAARKLAPKGGRQ